MFERKSICKRGHNRTPETVYKNGHCKACAIRRQSFYQANNPKRFEWQRAYNLKTKYNLTQTAYELMFMQQNGKCAICRNPDKLVVDHNHKTGTVRGLLCNNCNTMLGMAKDNEETLKVASGYVTH